MEKPQLQNNEVKSKLEFNWGREKRLNPNCAQNEFLWQMPRFLPQSITILDFHLFVFHFTEGAPVFEKIKKLNNPSEETMYNKGRSLTT